MTCAEHGLVVMDVARGLRVEAERLEGAQRHVLGCARCAADQREQRGAQHALRVLADASAGLSAPERVEMALLDAFRVRAAAGEPHGAGRPSWGWPMGLVAAAATLALVAGAALVARVGFTGAETPGAPPAPARAFALAAPLEALPVPSAGGVDAAGRSVSSPRGAGQAAAPRPARRAGAPVTRGAPSATSNAAWDPAALGFLSLPGTGGTMPADTAPIVRVKVSRASLAALGLPLAGEDLSQTVDADVLVGDDGLARAIRIVDETGVS